MADMFWTGAAGLLTIAILTTRSVSATSGSFSFASYYGDHMVLQRGPQRAIIWGYSPNLGDKVTVTVAGHNVSTTVVRGYVVNGGVWSVKLPAITNPGPYVITASSTSGTIQLNDVLFGDVWICSGQSNMQLTVSMAYNASQEIADADNYPNIRVMTVTRKASPKLEADLPQILQPWAVASNASIGGPDWDYFSAVCWFYGKHLYRHRGYPIGLIDSNWGGAAIEPWMTPDGLTSCNVKIPSPLVMAKPVPGVFYVPDEPTVMWNSMMAPLVNLTIYGVIWYQGETNARDPSAYKCLFPAMIKHWRRQFSEGSSGETDPTFPFGFVQIAPWTQQATIGNFPALRWAQTAGYGYVPNSVMNKVFMAVAMDLADYDSTWNTTHPKNKQDVGARLGLAAEAVAYGVPNVRYQGPFPTTVSVNPTSGIVTIEFDSGRTPIEVRSNDGYEVCCSTNVNVRCFTNDAEWTAAPISDHRTSSIDLAYGQNCGANVHVLGVRYAWRESPCPAKKCAIYSKSNALPAPPYLSLGYYA